MKKIGITLAFIFWMLMTFLLAISLVGLVVLIREDSNSSYFKGEEGEAVWFKIGKKLVDSLIS